MMNKWLVGVLAWLAILAAGGVVAQAPRNDNFQGAQALSGSSGRVTVANDFASAEIGEPIIPGVAAANRRTLWYRFASSQPYLMTLDVTTSHVPAALGVYTGSALNQLTPVSTAGWADYREFCTTPNVTYYIMLDTLVTPGTIVLNHRLVGTTDLVVAGVVVSQGTSLDGVSVEWTGSPAVERYNVRRGTSPDFGASTLVGLDLTSTSAFDTDPLPGVRTYYWVQGTRSCMAGNWQMSNPGYRSCTMTVAPLQRSVPAAAGTHSLDVTPNGQCPWVAVLETGVTWLTITDGELGEGPGELVYTVLANTALTARSARITIGGVEHVVTQSPAPCSFSLPITPANVSWQGGEYSVALTTTAGCEWTARSSASWIALLDTEGTGSGAIRYLAASNPSTTTRQGVISVGAANFTVSQAGLPPCSFQVPSVLHVPCEGGLMEFTVTANREGCCYVFDTTTPWLMGLLPTGQKCGTQTIQIAVPANSDTVERIGTFTAAGRTVTVRVQGCQPDCPISLAPPTVALGSAPTSASLVATTPGGCTIQTATSEAPSWLAVTSIGAGAAAGQFIVGYTTTANPGEDRQGTIRMATSDGVALFVVSQAGGVAEVRRAILAVGAPATGVDRNSDGTTDAADVIWVAP